MHISDWSSDVCSSDLKVTRLTDTPDGELNGVVSPKGGYVSFVRGGNFFVQPMGGAQRQLTQGAGDTVSWGVAEFVAPEEMERRPGSWWSPDARLIAPARVAASPVRLVPPPAIGGEVTQVPQQRYPA